MNILLKRLGLGDRVDDLTAKLLIAIGKLPRENRITIDLCYGNKLSRKEVASQLGWSVSKVNQKITRGVSLLKMELNPTYFEKGKNIINASSCNV